MESGVFALNDLPVDHPIPLLERHKIQGERILCAHILLKAGCHVAGHRHESEQLTYVMSGRARWTFGEPGTPRRETFEVTGDSVVLAPSNAWHEIVADEDTLLVDILSPPGAMGIDSQRA